jgi:hypothetical protein
MLHNIWSSPPIQNVNYIHQSKFKTCQTINDQGSLKSLYLLTAVTFLITQQSRLQITLVVIMISFTPTQVPTFHPTLSHSEETENRGIMQIN